jgi:hypothetical protein
MPKTITWGRPVKSSNPIASIPPKLLGLTERRPAAAQCAAHLADHCSAAYTLQQHWCISIFSAQFCISPQVKSNFAIFLQYSVAKVQQRLRFLLCYNLVLLRLFRPPFYDDICSRLVVRAISRVRKGGRRRGRGRPFCGCSAGVQAWRLGLAGYQRALELDQARQTAQGHGVFRDDSSGLPLAGPVSQLDGFRVTL